MMDKVNVITAGPSAGKSSTIRELSARGYRTLPEAARILFDQKISEGIDPEEVRARDDFHQLMEDTNRRVEREIPDSGVVFMDRSLADNIAYRRQFGADVPGELKEEVIGRYDNIFLLERIEFKDDEVRSEDEEEAAELQELLRQTYIDLGYEPVEVPVMPVDERADFIEKQAKRTPPIH